MRKRTRPQNRTSKNPQGRSRVSWRYAALTLLCGVILVSGFFFAARQHFSSMDYGIQNSRLRRQVDELEAEKRRLLLNREISLSPSEMIKAARKFAGGQFAAGPFQPVRPEQISAAANHKKIASADPVVQKTVISKPIQATRSPESKPTKAGSRAKTETVSHDKKNKS